MFFGFSNHETKDIDIEMADRIAVTLVSNMRSCMMEDLPSPVKTREEKKEKDELSRLTRSFLSCARSQNCHWVIE